MEEILVQAARDRIAEVGEISEAQRLADSLVGVIRIRVEGLPVRCRGDVKALLKEAGVPFVSMDTLDYEVRSGVFSAHVLAHGMWSPNWSGAEIMEYVWAPEGVHVKRRSKWADL